jgi:hypothetical protein
VRPWAAQRCEPMKLEISLLQRIPNRTLRYDWCAMCAVGFPSFRLRQHILGWSPTSRPCSSSPRAHSYANVWCIKLHLLCWSTELETIWSYKKCLFCVWHRNSERHSYFTDSEAVAVLWIFVCVNFIKHQTTWMKKVLYVAGKKIKFCIIR